MVSLPAFLAWEQRWKLKCRVLIVGVLGFVFLAVSMQMYRNITRTYQKVTLSENIAILSETLQNVSIRGVFYSEDTQFTLARRLSDYVATGWYIQTVPSSAPFRYFENVQYWPYLILPFFLRPTIPDTALQETASLTFDYSGYGWHKLGQGSSPAMILGDLYTRFGWPGIFFGMMLFGTLLLRFDRYFAKPTIQKQILFVMFWVIAWKGLTQSSLTGLFILFTRTFFICWCVSLVADRVIQVIQPRRFILR